MPLELELSSGNGVLWLSGPISRTQAHVRRIPATRADSSGFSSSFRTRIQLCCAILSSSLEIGFHAHEESAELGFNRTVQRTHCNFE